MRDPRVRFRVYIAGKLTAESWLDTSNPDYGRMSADIGDAHAELVNAAETRGQLWLIESYQPGLPEHRAYTRMGTDPAGMVDPIPLDDGQ